LAEGETGIANGTAVETGLAVNSTAVVGETGADNSTAVATEAPGNVTATDGIGAGAGASTVTVVSLLLLENMSCPDIFNRRSQLRKLPELPIPLLLLKEPG
jgi:hypothetical protein